VLLREALEALAVKPRGLYVDGTVGAGGHAAEILRASAPDGRLLGVDRDAEALEVARQSLASFGDRARLVHARFRQIPDLLAGERADGILLDLGMSSLQLDDPQRGFSFQADGPLDMRMDRTQVATAAEAVNRLPEGELAELFQELGEEPAARRVARAIVLFRRHRLFRTTGELASVVRSAARRVRRGIDPATRVFQALRIHVNRELEELRGTLERLAGCLAPGARLAVIAFHSLEDREVKLAFRALAGHGYEVLTRKPVRPREDELSRNPRSRSARLRVLLRSAEAPA